MRNAITEAQLIEYLLQSAVFDGILSSGTPRSESNSDFSVIF